MCKPGSRAWEGPIGAQEGESAATSAYREKLNNYSGKDAFMHKWTGSMVLDNMRKKDGVKPNAPSTGLTISRSEPSTRKPSTSSGLAIARG